MLRILRRLTPCPWAVLVTVALLWVAGTGLPCLGQEGSAPKESKDPAKQPAPTLGGGVAKQESVLPSGGVDILNMGDRITIAYADVVGAPGPSEQQIREDGKITLHLGLEVVAAGKKVGDLEREIERLYVEDRKLYKRITINIQQQARVFSVGGEVRNPGSTFVHTGEMTVIKAINAAGGFNEFAKKTKVVITRYATKNQEIIDCKKAVKNPQLDVKIYPGDHVFVPKSFF